ncbi:DUF7314 family protein [Halorientalis marina]|jgi:hypothetical protein|uniref:DUF7314 family protein n=1 Tax=Halorientalis marina TaxID=2931976 RepID=UPI001FF16DF5|nr:hypothetical protein [Halorientalis marina]
MADEFAKGLGILMTAGLGWMVLAGWYNTAGFEDTQLIAPDPENVEVYGQLGLLLKDALFWFALIGALTFWVIIPAVDEARDAWSDRNS